MYNCERCTKNFESKYKLNRHMNKKNICNIKTENKCNKCNKCFVLFASKQSLDRHKNKKIPCQPYINILEKENQLLKIENQNNAITNNQMINNNSHNNNNIINNNIIVAQEEFKNYIIDKCYSFKDLGLLINDISTKDEIDYLSLDINHDEDDVLQNTKDISALLELIFCNINLLKNFMFFKDFNNNQIYYKFNESELKKLSPHDILYIIAEVFKELINYNDLDDELKRFYKKYIRKYDNQDFKELDTKELKVFVKKLKENLDGSLARLNSKFKLYKKGEFEKLEMSRVKDKEKLIINKSERHNKLLEDEPIKLSKDPKKLFPLLKELFQDDDNIDDEYIFKIYEKTFNYDDIKYIRFISYFINDFYVSNKTSKIKYENNVFYSYTNNKWVKKNLDDIYNKFIDDMIKELHKYQYVIDNEIRYKYIIDIENEYYDFKESLYDRPYKFILKYLIVNKVSEIPIKKNPKIQDIVLY